MVVKGAAFRAIFVLECAGELRIFVLIEGEESYIDSHTHQDIPKLPQLTYTHTHLHHSCRSRNNPEKARP